MRPLLVISFYFAIFACAPLHLAALLAPEWRPDSLVLAILFTGPAAGWLAYRWRRNGLTRLALRVSYLWLGLGFTALMVLVPLALLRTVTGWHGQSAAWAAAALTAVVCIIALVNAQRLHVKTLTLRSAKLTRPLRIVQLSDVHVGSRLPAFLARVVKRANALAPDLVVITGDLVDMHDVGQTALAPLGELEAPVYFSIGNHERYVDCDALCQRIAATGVRVLRNEAARHGELQLIGIDDADDRFQVSKQLAALPCAAEAFTLLAYHRPDDVEAAAEAGVDLMLTGHTHNGQIVPFNVLVRRVYPRIAGHYEVDGTSLYVSTGTGTWGPVMRLGSRNELTLLTLEPA